MSSLRKRIYRYRYVYLLALPGTLYFLCFKIFPMWGVVLSFEKFKVSKGVFGSEWVWFQNYINFFRNRNFLQMLRNTLAISSINLFLGFPLPIILAILLNEIRNQKYKKAVQTLVYLPHFMSWVVIAGLTFFLFSVDIGVVNKLLVAAGREKVSFLTDPKLFWWILFGQSTWRELGWGSIVYLAAISQIDQTLYEAAEVDGASKWRQILHVTLPGIMPTVVVMFIMRLGTVLDTGIEQLMLMSNTFVSDVAQTFDLYAYQQGIQQGNYSVSVTVSVCKGLVGLVLVVLSNRAIKKTGNEGMF
ncbi:MAG: ABC transporter permease subunit [Eubacteriales bacterium]|nr:ABC transporter permease subunit [Eubacteriales bacterium]